MSGKGIFIAATGQNVGKSTLSLGIMAGLKKRYGKVGFIKPVGQRHVMVDGDLAVDKDVVLFHEQFDLKIPYSDMSPVLVPAGFTKRYLAGEVSRDAMVDRIVTSYGHIADNHDFTVVEGTGHVGVASIIDLNNAQVAALLGLDMIIIASGGLGSAHDELALNMAMCEKHGVKVRGVILNRVIDGKRHMILEHFPKSLEKWGVPLLGCVPYNDFLGTPSVRDFAALFDAKLLGGKKHQYRHFKHTRLVAGSLESYRDEIFPNQLIITPASREDIVRATLETHEETLAETGIDFEGGVIMTGRRPPSDELMEVIQRVDLPCLYAPLDSYGAMKKITSFIAKTGKDDEKKISQAIKLVENFIDFDILAG